MSLYNFYRYDNWTNLLKVIRNKRVDAKKEKQWQHIKQLKKS